MVCLPIDFKDHSGLECPGMGIWPIAGIMPCSCEVLSIHVYEWNICILRRSLSLQNSKTLFSKMNLNLLNCSADFCKKKKMISSRQQVPLKCYDC